MLGSSDYFCGEKGHGEVTWSSGWSSAGCVYEEAVVFSPVSIIVEEPRFMPLFLHCVCAFISPFYSLFSRLPPSLEVSCPVDFQWTVAFPLHDSIKHTLCLSVCCKYSCSSQLRNRK